MASLEFEMDPGQPAPASDFFMAGTELVRALGQVEVFGTLRRDENDDVFHISADGVNVVEGQSALTWDKIFGSDPDFTGGVPVDRYLEESRGEA